MTIHFIAGAVYLCAAAVASGATLDDKMASFEDAMKNAPEVRSDSTPSAWPRGYTPSVEDLQLVIQRGGDNEANIEGLVSRLMATHPSAEVQQAGEAVVLELEAQRKQHTQQFETKANAALAEATDAVTHAKSAADLDGILTEFKALQDPQNGSFGGNVDPVLANKVTTTFQFITQWQDYLAAATAGNWQEAQNALRGILNNQQINAPVFFPRSEILARYEESFKGGAQPPSTASGPIMDPDIVLRKMKKPEDVEPLFPDLRRIQSPPGFPTWDWSELMTLAKARNDALAGFTVNLDLKKAMNWAVMGDNVSRITAMELLVILPYYLGTDASAPPNENETLTAYLDRLSAKASTDGNLALLQRTVAVQVALGTSDDQGQFLGTKQFLAGLSQDAAGQYVPAVLSYENALKDPDRFLPVKIVGERLAAIKAAHPDEFDKGMTTFLTPAPIDPFNRPGMPPGMMPGMPGQFGNRRFNQATVLPIPMTISIPAQVTPPPAPSGSPGPPPSSTK